MNENLEIEKDIKRLEERLCVIYYGNKDGKETSEHFRTHYLSPSPESYDKEAKYIIKQLQQLWKTKLEIKRK